MQPGATTTSRSKQKVREATISHFDARKLNSLAILVQLNAVQDDARAIRFIKNLVILSKSTYNMMAGNLYKPIESAFLKPKSSCDQVAFNIKTLYTASTKTNMIYKEKVHAVRIVAASN